MSFCVNCGVKLASSEKRCPLCHTEVLNPRECKAPTLMNERPYPDHIELLEEKRVARRGFAILFAILLLIPILITLTVDLLANKSLSWSLIADGGIVLLFIWFGLPFIFKRANLTLFLCLDIISVFTYLFLIEQITGSKSGWFFRLGMPITMTAGILIVGLQLVFEHIKPPFLVRVALILFSIGSFVLMIELFITDVKIVNFWSVFVLIPCVLLGWSVLLIESRKNVKEFIRRKLFF